MKYYKLTDEEKNLHPCIHSSASIKAMKDKGFWGKHDKCVRCGDLIYNLSIVLEPNGCEEYNVDKGV